MKPDYLSMLGVKLINVDKRGPSLYFSDYFFPYSVPLILGNQHFLDALPSN